MAKFMITSIDWETDGEEVSLPIGIEAYSSG